MNNLVTTQVHAFDQEKIQIGQPVKVTVSDEVKQRHNLECESYAAIVTAVQPFELFLAIYEPIAARCKRISIPIQEVLLETTFIAQLYTQFEFNMGKADK